MSPLISSTDRQLLIQHQVKIEIDDKDQGIIVVHERRFKVSLLHASFKGEDKVEISSSLSAEKMIETASKIAVILLKKELLQQKQAQPLKVNISAGSIRSLNENRVISHRDVNKHKDTRADYKALDAYLIPREVKKRTISFINIPSEHPQTTIQNKKTDIESKESEPIPIPVIPPDNSIFSHEMGTTFDQKEVIVEEIKENVESSPAVVNPPLPEKQPPKKKALFDNAQYTSYFCRRLLFSKHTNPTLFWQKVEKLMRANPNPSTEASQVSLPPQKGKFLALKAPPALGTEKLDQEKDTMQMLPITTVFNTALAQPVEQMKNEDKENSVTPDLEYDNLSPEEKTIYAVTDAFTNVMRIFT